MQHLKKRERQNWILFITLLIKNANVFTMNNVIDVDLNRQFRAKKYFDIIKFFVYMKKIIMKLKNFIRACYNVFMIKFVIYQKHQFKINFAVFLLFIHVSNFEWTWFWYRLSVNIATKSISTWAEFCQFLKKQMNFSKLCIINVKTKLHAMKQRFNQTISQLIVYFETLKNQWTTFLSNSIKTNYLIQIFHEYIQKKLCRRNVDMFSRKIVEKTIFNIKNIEKKFVHFCKKRFKNPNNKNFKKRKRNEFNSIENRFNAITNSNKKFSNKKKQKIEKTNEIWQT